MPPSQPYAAQAPAYDPTAVMGLRVVAGIVDLLLYAVLAACLLLAWPPLLLAAMTLPAVAMSVFLGVSLIVNRRQCRICWAGHIANAVLFAALVSESIA
jgi:hypothetical protein